MKIRYLDSESTVAFGDLEIADWFEYNKKIFMKTLDVVSKFNKSLVESNAVATDGTFRFFREKDSVKKLYAELLVSEKPFDAEEKE